MTRREIIVVAAVTMLGAALRFATLDVQSLWFDEAVTAYLVELPLGDMLTTFDDTESTPPLYYLLVWGWSQLFGTGEVGLRTVSALAGCALIPVAWAEARAL